MALLLYHLESFILESALDKNHLLISEETHTTGTVHSVPFFVRGAIQRAIELHAVAMIFVHNHPSGDPTPSESDLDLFRQLKYACEVMNIELLGSVIVGHSGLYIHK